MTEREFVQLCNLCRFTGTSVNLALNRPAMKSYSYPGAMPGNSPSVMVNGNLADNVCTGINGLRPWMSIDLGEPTNVAGLAVTNSPMPTMRK